MSEMFEFEFEWKNALDVIENTLIDDYLFAFLVGLIVYAIIYWQFAVCKPKLLYSKASSDAKFSWDNLIPKMPTLTSYFYPTFWALNQQGIIFVLRPFLWIPPTPPSYIRKEIYTMKSDGQPVVLDWVEPEGENLPVIFLIPGVLGLTEDHYDMCDVVLKSKRYQMVIFNRRGHGHKLVTPRFATAGCNADFREILQHVRTVKPGCRVLGVAFSAGTANLFRYLGESGEESLIDAAVCISSGYDTDYCIENVPSFMGGLILGKMKEFWLHPNEELLRKVNPRGYEILSNAKTVWDFHKEVYRFNQPHIVQKRQLLRAQSTTEDEEEKGSEPSDQKRLRFESEESLSQKDWLKGVNPIYHSDNSRRPTLFIHAADDPVFPKTTMEYALPRLMQNPYNLMVEMKTGYHVCFFENFFVPSRWTNRVTMQFFDSIVYK
jgi:predicted alpha/beta-fold hydrolase